MRALAPLVASALLCAVSAADAATILLRDGSRIQGEVLTLSGGVYSIRSATLGTVTVPQADVQSISEADAPAAPAAAAAGAPSAQELQQRIASDPALMAEVNGLQNNPDVQSILNDPEIMNALRSGNLQVIMGNPKLARLASDPAVQSLIGKLAQ